MVRVRHRECLFANFVGDCVVELLPRFVAAPFPALVLATVISAMGSGMIEVTISPIVDAIPSNKKEADMSLLHSFYCWGQMTVVALSTLFVWFAGNSYWYVLPLVWACVPFVNLINFTTLPFPKTLREEEKIPLGKLFSERNFRIAMLLMLCAGASELAMSQWSSFFAETGLGVTKVMGDLLGPCLFAVFMGLGRLLFGIYGNRLDLKKAMFFCAVLCIVCYTTTAVSPNPLLALFGCAITGFSISLFWPGTFSLVSALYPNGGAAMFGVLAILGDVGCSVGPWIVSFVSSAAQRADASLTDGAALKVGLGFGNLFPIFAIIGLILLGVFRKSAGTRVDKTKS